MLHGGEIRLAGIAFRILDGIAAPRNQFPVLMGNHIPVLIDDIGGAIFAHLKPLRYLAEDIPVEGYDDHRYHFDASLPPLPYRRGYN
ncbi:hypothetical protein SDC9_181226 [bioreactor metagenome]|uniref:Uncharacterized protein n=1 Tax=bioreactor metagenome TaxID=1076179 RepID=A0A645H3X4_9ZZZZ